MQGNFLAQLGRLQLHLDNLESQVGGEVGQPG